MQWPGAWLTDAMSSAAKRPRSPQHGCLHTRGAPPAPAPVTQPHLGAPRQEAHHKLQLADAGAAIALERGEEFLVELDPEQFLPHLQARVAGRVLHLDLRRGFMDMSADDDGAAYL